MIVLPILAASVMSVPELERDFVRRVARNRPGNEVIAEMLLGPDGRVEQCKVLFPAPDSRPSKRFCEAAIGQKAADPPVGPDGNPTYGVVSFNVILTPAGTPPNWARTWAPDIEMTVATLPDQYGTRARVNLVAFVSEEGSIVECGALGDSSAAYAAVACDQLKQEPRPVMRNRAGEPVAHVDSLLADFVLETPAG